MDPIGTDKSSRVKECPETLTPADAKSVQLKYKSHDTVSNLEHKLVDPSNRSNRAFVIKVTVADADGASSEVNFRVTPYTAVVLENTASVVVGSDCCCCLVGSKSGVVVLWHVFAIKSAFLLPRCCRPLPVRRLFRPSPSLKCS